MIQEIWSEALKVSLLLTGAPLIVMVVLGLTMAVIQTAVSVQEQSLNYLIKLGAMGGVLFVLWGWASENLIRIMEAALMLE